MQIRKRNASLVCCSIACSFNFSQAPGGKLRKKKSNTIPCLGQVLTCLGQRQVKMHTLFRTARPKNHTLSSGTSPYSPNKGVPPPPGCQAKKVSLTNKTTASEFGLWCESQVRPFLVPAWGILQKYRMETWPTKN